VSNSYNLFKLFDERSRFRFSRGGAELFPEQVNCPFHRSGDVIFRAGKARPCLPVTFLRVELLIAISNFTIDSLEFLSHNGYVKL